MKIFARKTYSYFLIAAFGFNALAMLTGSAEAAPVVYSSRTDWSNATQGQLNRDFNGLSGGDVKVNGLVDHGVTFSASNTYLYSLGQASGYNYGTGTFLLGPSWPNKLNVALNASAIGVDLLLLNPSLIDQTPGKGIVAIDVGLASGEHFSEQLNIESTNSFYFFGIASDIAITSLSFGPPRLPDPYYCDPSRCYNGLASSNLVIDNFSTGSVIPSTSGSSVPEPSTWTLIVIALGGICVVRRKGA